jgi:N-formylglutamate amidohydrolase
VRNLWLILIGALLCSCVPRTQNISSFDSTLQYKDTLICPQAAFTSMQGDFPLILTNEHGADRTHIIQGIPERTGVGADNRKINRFVRATDHYTDQITLGIAAEIERLIGLKPYVLIAKLNRAQIDFNRPAKLAYERPELKPCYDDFHGEMNSLVKQVKQQWKYAYLLDIHGQSKFPNHLIRGTRNGLSLSQLRQREGEGAYRSDKGLFGLLKAKGYLVLPRDGTQETVYKGGYMLKTYGSQHEWGVDAVQIEIGRSLRNDSSEREIIAKDIAEALVQRLKAIEIL